MTTLCKAVVFKSDDGNRFLVPGLYWRADADVPPARMFHAVELCMIAGIEREPELLEFDADSLVNYVTFVSNRGFAHGGLDVVLISGPTFDRALAETPAND